MKKYISFSLAILLLFSLTIPVQASENIVMLTASATNLQQGDSFTVTVSLNGAQTAALGTVKLEFDSELLTLTGGTCHISGVDIGQVVPEKNAATFLFKDGVQTLSGSLFTFNFTVKKDITYTTISAVTVMGDTTVSPVTSGSVTVSVYEPGDVNGDDSLGNEDVFYFLWHIFQEDDYCLCVDGDLNRDGYVTTADVIYLLWHLLFGNAYPL